MKMNRALESLTAYKAGPPLDAIREQYGIDQVVLLGANECPEGPFPEVLEAISAAAGALNRYPAGDCDALRAALADRLAVDPARLVFGNGSCELIMLLGETLLGPGDHMVFADPSFVVYRSVALARQAEFDAVPLREHVHDLEAMAAAVRPETNLLIVCEPNNPTGTYVGPTALRRFLEAVPRDTVVVLDEAYTEYVSRTDHEDTVRWTDEYENLVVLRTFSKIYGLAGLRVGYGVFHPSLTQALDKLRQPYNVNSLAQAAACEALRHPQHVAARQAHVWAERARIVKELSEIGVRTVPTEANFLLVNVEDLCVPAKEMPQSLLERGLLVRSGWGIGCPGWMRVTVGTRAENDIFLATMRESARKGVAE
jgi:histidinol-phosphate aminotransferase